MLFAVMQWVGDAAKAQSIFGVLDKNKPGQLPSPSPNGHWADFRTIDESRFKFAAEAKIAITERGYFLMGASVTVTEAFGVPPSN